MARLLGSGRKFNNDDVMALAAAGKTVNEIVEALGTSRKTFFRAKSSDEALRGAYEAGVNTFAAGVGRKTEMKAGALKVVPIDAGEVSSKSHRADLVLAHLLANPGDRFYGIRRGTLLTSDEISEVLADLMLVQGVVRARRDQQDTARYFVLPQGRSSFNPQQTQNNGIGFNRNQSTGIFNQTSGRQSAR
jgi:hypothetical protein